MISRAHADRSAARRATDSANLEVSMTTPNIAKLTLSVPLALACALALTGCLRVQEPLASSDAVAMKSR